MTPIRLTEALLLALSLTASAAAAAGPAARAGSKPNVLVLFADDLGVGDLGVTGHPTVSSPNIDKLANSGVRPCPCPHSRGHTLTHAPCAR